MFEYGHPINFFVTHLKKNMFYFHASIFKFDVKCIKYPEVMGKRLLKVSTKHLIMEADRKLNIGWKYPIKVAEREKRIRTFGDKKTHKAHHSKYLELLELKCKYKKT